MLLFTEKTIWCACLKGDNKAFEKLYKLYYPLLFNYGRKFSPDPDLIRDCIQNLFIKLIRGYQNLSEPPSVKGYLLKAFRHHLYDALRERSVHNALFSPCIDELLSFEGKEIVSGDTEDQTENSIIVRRAFRKLSPRQQEILYLYYVMEADHAEISTALNINYQSSKNLLSRSLAKLRIFFEEETEKKKETLVDKEMLIIDSHEYQSQDIR